MESLQMIVQQGTARKPLTRVAPVASRFILALARFLSSSIKAALNVSRELKRHLSLSSRAERALSEPRRMHFNLLEKFMVRRLLKLPI